MADTSKGTPAALFRVLDVLQEQAGVPPPFERTREGSGCSGRVAPSPAQPA